MEGKSIPCYPPLPSLPNNKKLGQFLGFGQLNLGNVPAIAGEKNLKKFLAIAGKSLCYGRELRRSNISPPYLVIFPAIKLGTLPAFITVYTVYRKRVSEHPGNPFGLQLAIVLLRMWRRGGGWEGIAQQPWLPPGLPTLTHLQVDHQGSPGQVAQLGVSSERERDWV